MKKSLRFVLTIIALLPLNSNVESVEKPRNSWASRPY